MSIKQEIRTLASRHLDHTLMYPGKYLFTWMRVGAVWHLVGMDEVEQSA